MPAAASTTVTNRCSTAILDGLRYSQVLLPHSVDRVPLRHVPKGYAGEDYDPTTMNGIVAGLPKGAATDRASTS